MASGNYSTVRPATVTAADVEIYYNYTPNRQTAPGPLNTLDAGQVLFPVLLPNDANQQIGGLYTLKLPANSFQDKGIYTVFLRPAAQRVTITDCGVLSALPEQKGLVLNINDFNDNPQKITPSGLMGHRVEYLEADGSLRPNFFTIITSSNRCEAVNQNIGNSSQRAVTYRFNDTASLLYLTVTPSTAPSVKANANPFIGRAGQDVLITNPYVDPMTLELEVAEYGIDDIANALYGEQTRNIGDGVVTWYKTVNGERRIYKQVTLGEIKDQFQTPLIEFKEALPVLDSSKEWDTLLGDVEEV